MSEQLLVLCYNLFLSFIIIATGAVSQRPTLPSLCTRTSEIQAHKRTFDDELISFNCSLQSKNALWESEEGTSFEEMNQPDRYHDQDSIDQERKHKKRKVVLCE